MPAPTSGPTLTCSQCGYVNEAERVYCHNCGSKLDRSVIPRPEESKQQEDLARTRRRVKKLTNPGSNPIQRELKALMSTLVWAVIVAAVIQFFREPDGVPPVKSQELSDRMVGSEIMEAVDSPQPRMLVFKEFDVNEFFKQSLRTKVQSAVPMMKYDRAFVGFEPGVCRITLQLSIWGYPIYSRVNYKIGVKDGKFFADCIGGSFGRMAVAPALMKYTDFNFKNLWAGLKRERGEMDKMQSVEVGKGTITLVTKGAGR